MDEKKLTGFVGIYEHRSMTKAAEYLYTTPPALMRQLDALEAELGVPLFRRSPAGCVPTEAGELLYARIVPVLQEMKDIRTQIALMSRDNRRIALCVPVNASLPLQDLYCEKLIEAYPDVQIQYVVSNVEKRLDLVRSGEADCALMAQVSIKEIEEAGFSFAPVGERQIIGIMASGHPLSGRKLLDIREIDGLTVCADKITYETIRESLELHHVKVEIASNEMSVSELFNYCRKGGIRLTSSPYGDQFASLVSVPIDLPPMVCGWVTQKRQSPMIRELIRISREYNDSI